MRKSITGIITGIAVMFMVAASSAPASALSTSATHGTNNSCLQFTNHEYEVCTAYIFNSSLADLLPYYEYAHSPNGALSSFVQYRLGSRYTGQAYNVITNRVASWPMGDLDVGVPKIKILSVHSSLATNTATLKTEETWKIKTESGAVVYREKHAVHAITMQRVPSYILHKWVVTNIF